MGMLAVRCCSYPNELDGALVVPAPPIWISPLVVKGPERVVSPMDSYREAGEACPVCDEYEVVGLALEEGCRGRTTDPVAIRPASGCDPGAAKPCTDLAVVVGAGRGGAFEVPGSMIYARPRGEDG